MLALFPKKLLMVVGSASGTSLGNLESSSTMSNGKDSHFWRDPFRATPCQVRQSSENDTV